MKYLRTSHIKYKNLSKLIYPLSKLTTSCIFQFQGSDAKGSAHPIPDSPGRARTARLVCARFTRPRPREAREESALAGSAGRLHRCRRGVQRPRTGYRSGKLYTIIYFQCSFFFVIDFRCKVSRGCSGEIDGHWDDCWWELMIGKEVSFFYVGFGCIYKNIKVFLNRYGQCKSIYWIVKENVPLR